MDKTKMITAMKTSISEVLEQMFFLPIDLNAPDAGPSDPEPGDASIIAKLGFSGSPSGTFWLQVPEVLAQSVSADFLGVIPQKLSADQVTGTVLEMVNMLAGGTLSTYNPRALFDLQIPELIPIHDKCTSTKEDANSIIIRIQTPESWMTFQLIIQRGKD